MLGPSTGPWDSEILPLPALLIFSSNLSASVKINGIDSLVHYPIPLHLQEAYQDLGYKKGDFRVTEKCSETVLSLPIFPELEKEKIECIVKIIKSVKWWLK